MFQKRCSGVQNTF